MVQQGGASVSLCLLMMLRNEESNLRLNLSLWRDLVDCYVFGIDDRTTDESEAAIAALLPPSTPRIVFKYTFDGFSAGRNELLREAWRSYSNATHVLMADPDWRPDLQTIRKNDLDLDHQTFEFMIWDRSGHTTRQVAWLQRHIPNLAFKYRLHEVLDVPGGFFPVKNLSWEVREVEGPQSWHTPMHGHSRSAARYAFDLSLLEKDYAEMPDDLHTLFYMGITTMAHFEMEMGNGVHQRTPERQEIINRSMSYFERVHELYGSQGPDILEMVWSSVRWLAYGYHYLAGDAEVAKHWYLRCIELDPKRPDCQVFYSRLLLEQGRLDDAWARAQASLLMAYPKRQFANFYYTYECFLPVQAAMVIKARIEGGMIGADTEEDALRTGTILRRHFGLHCDKGPIMDSEESVAALAQWFDDRERDHGEWAAKSESKGAAIVDMLARKWGGERMAGDFDWGLQIWDEDEEQEQIRLMSEAAAGATASGTEYASDMLERRPEGRRELVRAMVVASAWPGARELHEAEETVRLYEQMVASGRPFDVSYFAPSMEQINWVRGFLRPLIPATAFGKTLQLALGTLEELAETDFVHPFDLIDIGGTLSTYPGGMPNEAVRGMVRSALLIGAELHLWVLAKASPLATTIIGMRTGGSSASDIIATVERQYRHYYSTPEREQNAPAWLGQAHTAMGYADVAAWLESIGCEIALAPGSEELESLLQETGVSLSNQLDRWQRLDVAAGMALPPPLVHEIHARCVLQSSPSERAASRKDEL
jgi:tetratricopeptide (TPR) repeat protein